MFKKIFAKYCGKRNEETRKVVRAVTKESISGAYVRRAGDIDSLRRYDRGEKKINAPDLKHTVPSVRRAT